MRFKGPLCCRALLQIETTKMVQAVTDIDDAPLEEYADLPSENDPKGTRCSYWSVSHT